jgi:hypothetical protein
LQGFCGRLARVAFSLRPICNPGARVRTGDAGHVRGDPGTPYQAAACLRST